MVKQLKGLLKGSRGKGRASAGQPGERSPILVGKCPFLDVLPRTVLSNTPKSRPIQRRQDKGWIQDVGSSPV